jgi:hypothetical protein
MDTMRNNLISMVVDGLPEHYYKAELLLFTLDRLAQVPAANILVQCVDRVDPAFIRFVQDRGHRCRTIAPYLDGAYCNKLQQLEGLEPELQGIAGLFLLDIDMVVLDRLELPVPETVCGKVVDAPNPPLPILQRIFAAAGIPRPADLPCDWGMGPTVATNWNGGFLYVPTQWLNEVSTRWRHWGSWLFKHPELFDDPGQRVHTDQVALALALAAGSIPFAPLPANLNFPTHTQQLPSTFDSHQPLRVLHYHAGLDAFGLLQPTLKGCAALDTAIEQVNGLIAEQRIFRFFDGYKRDQARKARQPGAGVATTGEQLQTLLQQVGLLNGQRRRLILHTGTPKTGTSSLQYSFDQHREVLRRQGILYPRSDGSTKMPKHQWLANCLVAADEAQFCQHLRAGLAEMDAATHTVFYSTEGLFNHWWDFPPAAKALLATLTQGFAVEIWVWFREPESFISSCYRQFLSNPRLERIAVYGRDLAVADMLDDPWFVRHLDYLGFVREAQSLMGEAAVQVIRYTGDTVATAVKRLGVSDWPGHETRQNPGIGAVGVDLMRRINRHPLTAPDKEQAMRLIKELDRLLSSHQTPFELSESDRRRVQRMTALGGAVLAAEFGLNWSSVASTMIFHSTVDFLLQ